MKITVTDTSPPRPRKRAAITPLTLSDLADLQEGQDLDFKREVNIDTQEQKSRLLDDVVAFLNRGPSRIVVGVVEAKGRVESFRPMGGDADKLALRLQTVIQDGISPVPLDVQVLPIHGNEGFLLDIQIPQHRGGPFMNRISGSYLIRSGAKNLPIDPGSLRSRFVDERAWLSLLDELVAREDEAVADGGRLASNRTLRIAILPREHFDHMRENFTQDDYVRSTGPHFHEHSEMLFKVCEDGHEAIAINMAQKGLERLFIRDDWFVHAQVAFAIQERPGEGTLALPAFNENVRRYLRSLDEFLREQGIEGPFAVTLALRSLGETEHFGAWFPRTTTVRTLRPRFVDEVDDPGMVDDFLRRVRQATVWG